MKIDFKEISNEAWELFARDFFAEQGFVIDIGPGRGADQGKDLLISEQLKGRLVSQKFTWLVSCKHFSVSNKSVGQDSEINITDRIKQHGADGFIGFYSTIASSSLISRLQGYVANKDLKSYEIFDYQKIAGYFFTVGSSKLAMRYFPNSYGMLRPIQKILNEYHPLNCEICNKDILLESLKFPYTANIIYSTPKDNYQHVESVFIVCKTKCDEILGNRLFHKGFITSWEDVTDLCNPLLFMQDIFLHMNYLYEGRSFSKQAYQTIKLIYLSLAQRTLREVTEEDEKRFSGLAELNLL